jgi:excisionase family DNA binding protein
MVSPWLTVEQAAAYLSMSRSSLYRAIQDGDLVPDGRVGRRRSPRFRMETLDAYARSGLVESANDDLGRPGGGVHGVTDVVRC